jgi:hypothetical protein
MCLKDKYNIAQIFELIVSSEIMWAKMAIDKNETDKVCTITLSSCVYVECTYQKLLRSIRKDVGSVVLFNVVKKDGDFYSKLEIKLPLK